MQSAWNTAAQIYGIKIFFLIKVQLCSFMRIPQLFRLSRRLDCARRMAKRFPATKVVDKLLQL